MEDATTQLDAPDPAALQAGDQGAWRDFFALYDPVIRSVVSWPKWHFDPHVRDDVAQNIRSSLVKSLDSLRDAARMKSFVRRISVNRCIDEIRRQVRQREHVVPLGHWNSSGEWEQTEVPDDRYDPVRDVLATERAARLRKVLAAMDAVCRTAISQFYLEGMSYRDMAAQQEVTVNTVGSRLSRCLEKLRAKLQHHSA